MLFRKKPQNLPPRRVHVVKPEIRECDCHPEFLPFEEEDEYPIASLTSLEDATAKMAPDTAKLLSIFNSPIAGSCAVFVNHNPKDANDSNFGLMIDVDNPAFQEACQDITVYDKDMNVIGDKGNIAAVGITFKEEYARPVVDGIESVTSSLRVKYNQIYGLQRSIIDRE